MVQEEHGHGGPAKQVFVVVEDEHFIDARSLSGFDFIGDGDQLASSAWGEVVDGGLQGDGVPSGGEAGAACGCVGQRKQSAAMDEAVNIQDLLVDDHFHFCVAVGQIYHPHFVGLQVLAARIETRQERFVFFLHNLIIDRKTRRTTGHDYVIIARNNTQRERREMGSTNFVLQIVIGLILVAYCAFQLYSSVKLYFKNKAGVQEYMGAHPDGKMEKYSLGLVYFILFCAILSIGLAASGKLIAPEGQNPILYQVTYLCIGLIFLGLGMDAWIHRHVIFSDDGFYIGGEVYRYRMVSSVVPKNGLINKNIKLRFANGSELDVPNKLGQAIDKNWQAWKAAKKERKSRRHR